MQRQQLAELSNYPKTKKMKKKAAQRRLLRSTGKNGLI
jgi:hypothetical protein